MLELLVSYKNLMKNKCISRPPYSRYRKCYIFFCSKMNIFIHLKKEYQFFLLISFYKTHPKGTCFVNWLKEKSVFLLVSSPCYRALCLRGFPIPLSSFDFEISSEEIEKEIKNNFFLNLKRNSKIHNLLDVKSFSLEILKNNFVLNEKLCEVFKEEFNVFLIK